MIKCKNRIDLVWRRENCAVVWFHSTLDVVMMTMMLTLKMVMIIVTVMTILMMTSTPLSSSPFSKSTPW